MTDLSAGFREIEHTADWELEVWAPDLPQLFSQAAYGMNSLMDLQLEKAPRVERRLELSAADVESLLVSFLDELLYLIEGERLGFDAFELQVSDGSLRGSIAGAPVVAQAKEIKAVTYHRLKIAMNGESLRVRIVFDV